MQFRALREIELFALKKPPLREIVSPEIPDARNSLLESWGLIELVQEPVPSHRRGPTFGSAPRWSLRSAACSAFTHDPYARADRAER